MKSVYSIDELDCSALRLSYDEWLNIPEPPIFNFVEAQEESNWLLIQHVPRLFAYASLVTLVKVGEQLYKLNGKRRKDLWLSGEINPPEFMVGLIYEITDVELESLNTEVRNKQIEALPAHEVVKVIYADLGLVFSSDRLRNGFINEAINVALRGKQRAFQDRRTAREKEDINMKKAIELFAKELKLIDNLNPKADIFPTGVLAGVLIMLGLNKPIGEFLVRLNEYQGKTKDLQDDPVECLLKAIHRFRISQRNIQPRMAIDLCKKTIHAISLWEEGSDSPKYWRKRDLTGHSLTPYIRELKQLKQINDALDL